METRAHHLMIGSFAIGISVLTVLFLMWISRCYIGRSCGCYRGQSATAKTTTRGGKRATRFILINGRNFVNCWSRRVLVLLMNKLVL